jgi:hypothetical protein
VLAVVDGVGVAIGLADLGTVQVVPPADIGRRLTGAEMSDKLKREPVRRAWPDGDELADALLSLNRAKTGPDEARFGGMSVSGHR